MSWLVSGARLQIQRTVRVRALAEDIVFTLTVPLSTQVYKLLPAKLMMGITLRWTSNPSRGELELLLVATTTTETGGKRGLMSHLARVQTYLNPDQRKLWE